MSSRAAATGAAAAEHVTPPSFIRPSSPASTFPAVFRRPRPYSYAELPRRALPLPALRICIMRAFLQHNTRAGRASTRKRGSDAPARPEGRGGLGYGARTTMVWTWTRGRTVVCRLRGNGERGSRPGARHRAGLESTRRRHRPCDSPLAHRGGRRHCGGARGVARVPGPVAGALGRRRYGSGCECSTGRPLPCSARLCRSCVDRRHSSNLGGRTPRRAPHGSIVWCVCPSAARVAVVGRARPAPSRAERPAQHVHGRSVVRLLGDDA